MLEPSRLPVELFTIVIDYATDSKRDIAALCNFSLVSRQWYVYLNDRVYSRWLYDGEHHSISSLWKFLRTILCNAGIADRVRELNIRNWTLGLVHGRSRLVLSEDDLDLIRSSIHTKGLHLIETRMLEAVQKADPRPLMALLLANLRNLTTLYAHLPETDIFLAEVLRNAVESRRDQPQSEYSPLRGLCEAHLASAWNYRKDDDHYKLELNHLWPVFQLPNIQRLSIFDFDSLGASNRFGDSLKTSSITDLTLVHDISYLAVPDTMALLTLPKKLTKLSFYLNDCDLWGNSTQISNTDLWNCICQYEDCIEHLDIYRDCKGWYPPMHRDNNSHFGSMQGCKRLESLCIQPEVLLGGCCGDDLAPYSLSETLPPNLKSLTFYGDEGLALNKTLALQLQDVIMSTDFPRLGHVALEMTFKHIHYYINPADPPHHAVEQACRERAIKYETKQASSCTKGGMGRRYYRYVAEKRLQMSKKLEKVRYALDKYVDRLGESTYKDESFSGDRPELSLDDLDTYELPWDELTSEGLGPNSESESERHSDVPSSEDEDRNTDGTAPQNIYSEEGNSEGSTRDAGEYDCDSDGVW